MSQEHHSGPHFPAIASQKKTFFMKVQEQWQDIIVLVITENSVFSLFWKE